MRQLSNWENSKRLRSRLRQDASQAEIRLWQYLRKRRFLGYKFRRQHSFGRYVVDFYCPELELAIEVDGDSHYLPGREAYDRKRQRWLEWTGVRFIRFWNNEVLEDMEGVLRRLETTITTPKPLLGTASSRATRGPSLK